MAPAEPIEAIDPTISMKNPQLQDISCRGILDISKLHMISFF